MASEINETNNFFPPIGRAVGASQVAGLHENLKGNDQEESAELFNDGEGTEPLCAGVDTIESLCMDCGKNGITRMLLTSIPFFKEVIIVSFKCPHCHCSNNSIQSAGQIQIRGSRYVVKNISSQHDLNRQIIKSDHCIIRLKELELEIPKGRSKLTTVEGLIRDTVDDLSFNQVVRKHTDPSVYEKIENLLKKLNSILNLSSDPFSIELEDITGNSFIEAIDGFSDPKWSKTEFNRTPEQNIELGLMPANDKSEESTKLRRLTEDFEGEDPDEVYSFPAACSSCGKNLDTRMKSINIPHFKEVVLMSTSCDSCGYRDNEIKSGGAISKLGTKIVLKVNDKEDLSRDLLKSETASLSIPEIDLHLNPGTLGGRFTTVEGIMTQIYEELDQKVFARGDSTTKNHLTNAESGKKDEKSRSSPMKSFLKQLKLAIDAKVPFTMIIDDPLSNSHIQNIYAPDPDPCLTKTEYERTFDQNEELGLNDMKTENY
ncbi:ZPR1 zinc-finger domain-containing protein [Phakopsora pachyrhizi]|uniref:ZPR1 zinc-finger domain-domain-containing protein n=1 Tax=Phakopsora pachyrhizi TaxID=170000 RepID=A0AAV0B640_PHAPC|nr:ZPR1 zinc-finger domain-containing protein [Phakopsora pachyrhizi]CAH7681122.1 ZPR1 zinc-finger domain-domain-containing protein [Phakopsora pachyrhizi]